MRTGWEIVIAGRDFDPAGFFAGSRIQPCHLGRREEAGEEGPHPWTVAEFTDWHEGAYPLDMATEALDYLRAHEDEFRVLCGWPGVEVRGLNFVGNDDFDFSPADVALLAALGFSVSIDAVSEGSHIL